MSTTTTTTTLRCLQPLFDSSVDLLCHPLLTTTTLSYRFPIFETSATALCGTYWWRHRLRSTTTISEIPWNDAVASTVVRLQVTHFFVKVWKTQSKDSVGPSNPWFFRQNPFVGPRESNKINQWNLAKFGGEYLPQK